MDKNRYNIRLIGALLVLALVAPLAGQVIEPSAEPPCSPNDAVLNDALWSATVAVESGGDACAYNATSGATGIAQIRTVCLDDCNRIARLRSLDVQFAPADRLDPEKSRQMWALYLGYYGDKYASDTGDSPTPEVYARMWKGGPTGWRKPSTTGYWDRVRAVME